MAEEFVTTPEKEVPSPEQPEKKVRKRATKQKELPAVENKEKTMPVIGNTENTVKIGGKNIEIKPTKLKYHRNNTAFFYKIIETVPLPDIMNFPKGTFGDERDGDKALMDWLIAATDDPELIYENYNELDTETVEQVLAIFKRVNRIDEKEAAQKNAVSQAEKESH